MAFRRLGDTHRNGSGWTGGQVVAGSNPVSPTFGTRSDQCRSGFFLCPERPPILAKKLPGVGERTSVRLITRSASDLDDNAAVMSPLVGTPRRSASLASGDPTSSLRPDLLR